MSMLKKLFFIIGLFFYQVCAQDISQGLKTLKGRLGDLQRGLTDLKKSLGALRSKLAGKEMLEGPERGIPEDFSDLPESVFDMDKTQLERWLRKYAEVNGYGYKTANLELLKQFAQHFGKAGDDGYSVSVPAFHGIADPVIKDFLRQQGLALDDEWQAIVMQLANKQAILQGGTIPATFWQQTALLEEKIKTIFANVTLDSFAAAFSSGEIDGLIKQAGSQGLSLIVRSTGKEDTDKLANAGGNESVVNVTPTTQDVFQSMGDVIASYVSRTSLEQRLQSGDTTIFDVPFIPVLIQVMIGENRIESEKNEDAVPLCGVMFTEDPEGAVSKLQPRDNRGLIKVDAATGRVKTSGITLVQVAYGHNEGVVNSKVDVDTYYMLDKQEIYSIVKPKRVRLAPAESGTLIELPNPRELVYEKNILRYAGESLFVLSEALEVFYKKPMDVEFAIDRQKKAIFLLQARPIVHPIEQQNSGYVSRLDTLPEDKKVKAYVIGSAGGAVRVIQAHHNLIMKPSIRDALQAYLALPADQKRAVECIIVRDAAPSTSHEATNFRTFQKPVVYLEERFSEVQNWFNAGKAFLVDVQQEVIVDGQGIITNDGGLPPDFLTMGNKRYPSPELLSLPNYFIQDKPASDYTQQEIGERIGQVLTRLAMLSSPRLEDNDRDDLVNEVSDILREKGKKNFLKELLKELRSESGVVATRALYKMVVAVGILFRQLSSAADKQEKKKITLFMNYFLDKALALRPYLAEQTKSNKQQKKLLALNALRALLYQHVPAEHALNAFSLTQFLKNFDRDIKARKSFSDIVRRFQKLKVPDPRSPGQIKKADLSSYVHELAKIEQLALTDATKDAWRRIINQILDKENAIELLITLSQCVARLTRAGIVELWLLIAVSQEGVTINTLLDDYKQALNPMDKSERSRLDAVERIDNLLNEFTPSLWDDPAQFENQWKKLRLLSEDYDKIVLRPSPLLSKDNPRMHAKYHEKMKKDIIAKLCAYIFMKKIIDIFDLSIKTLIASGSYILDDKLVRVNFLLQHYAHIAKTWEPFYDHSQFVNFTYPPGDDDKSKLIENFITQEMRGESNLEATLTSIFQNKYEKLEQEDKEKLLYSSSNFDVSLVVLGNRIEKDRYTAPVTLDDYFTFFHQSLLVMASSLFRGYFIIPDAALPQFLVTSKNTLEKEFSPGLAQNHSLKLLGIEYAQQQLTYSYNYILRHHSAQLYLTYDVRKRIITLKGSMFGIIRYGRWEKIADFIEAVSLLNNLRVHTSVSEGAVEFEWVINNVVQAENQLKKIVDMVKSAGEDLSLAGVDTSKPHERTEENVFKKFFTSSLSYKEKSKVIKGLIDLSLGTKGRVHWYLVRLLNKDYLSPNDPEYAQYVNKLLDILEKLYDPSNRSYAQETEFFDYSLISFGVPQRNEHSFASSEWNKVRGATAKALLQQVKDLQNLSEAQKTRLQKLS